MAGFPFCGVALYGRLWIINILMHVPLLKRESRCILNHMVQTPLDPQSAVSIQVLEESTFVYQPPLPQTRIISQYSSPCMHHQTQKASDGLDACVPPPQLTKAREPAHILITLIR